MFEPRLILRKPLGSSRMWTILQKAGLYSSWVSVSRAAELWGTYCSGMGKTRDIVVRCNIVNLDLILVQKEKLIQMTVGEVEV